jgi:ABC-type transporter Mla subunit MlaD
MADATENTIRKLLENLEKVSTDLKKGKVNEIIKTAIETVKSAVKDLASVVQSEKGKTDHLQNQVRNQGDEIDHQKQRNMKGKIIIYQLPRKGNLAW